MAHVMDMSIIELAVIEENRRLFRVQLDYDDAIYVDVTNNPYVVTSWILMVKWLNYYLRPEHLVVGVRVEWLYPSRWRLWQRSYRAPDILQICVGGHCLIFQIFQANGIIPPELAAFLGDNRFTFVGVQIRRFSLNLYMNYGIRFGERIVDLNDLPAIQVRRRNNGFFGLRQLTNIVLGKDYERPTMITMSRWDSLILHHYQILFASVDAFICCKIGVIHQAWELSSYWILQMSQQN